jgi:tetratricopeptide (TPR) repeat protein
MKFKPFNSISVFFALLALCGCDSKETKLQRFLIQGNEMAQKQNFAQARRYFNEALKIDSCFSDAWNNLGTISYRQSNFQEAFEFYSNAIHCNSKFYPAYLNRANASYELGNSESGLKDLMTYETNNPDTFVIHFSRGLLLSKQRKFPHALASFHKGLKMSKGNVEILVNIGAVHYQMHALDSAEEYLNRALLVAEDEPNIFNTLALVELERNRLGKALDHITRAISLQRDNSYFLNNRGYIYLLSGDLDRAIADINQSISEDPYNAWAYRNKGLYYLKRNDRENAVRLLKRAEELDSSVDSLFTYMARALTSSDRSGSCAYYQKARVANQVSDAEVSRYCR